MLVPERAAEAHVVRKLFSSSPQDPRYHMLSHLSSKFREAEKQQRHEPRAALFLNRFTRTLTIMYATNGVSEILGISGEEMKGRSFYYCIQQNCLEDAVRCLENAKGNDSIAYLRFWYRDPRQDDQPETPDGEAYSDEEMTDALVSSEDEDDGGTEVQGQSYERSTVTQPPEMRDIAQGGWAGNRLDTNQSNSTDSSSRMSTGVSTQSAASRLSTGPRTSSYSASARTESSRRRAEQSISPNTITSASSVSTSDREPIELEAVVSCTSDGLVVCLRRARPAVPQPVQRPTQQSYTAGLFAAPWAAQPIMPSSQRTPSPYAFRNGYSPYSMNSASTPGSVQAQQFNPSQYPHYQPYQPQKSANAIRHDIMTSIREVGVFAWALAGINGSLEQYSRGKPKGESQPPGGLPVWSPGIRGGESPRSNSGGNGYGSYSGNNISNSNSNCNNTESNSQGQFWNKSTSAPRTSPYTRSQAQSQFQPQVNGYLNTFGDPGLSRNMQNVWGSTGNNFHQAPVSTNGAIRFS